MSSRRNKQSLFLTVSGKPMRFYMRPGENKVKLLPIISDGGGVLCRSTDPDVIQLANPADMEHVSASRAALYVSTEYIYDCVQKNKQLDLEDYRCKPTPIQAGSDRKKGEDWIGRTAYSPEEDTAILDFISNYKEEAGGNRVWQEMEKLQVTRRTWQSMKARYRKILRDAVPTEKRSELQPDAQRNDAPQTSRPHDQQAAPEELPPGSEHSADSDVPEPDAAESDVPEPAPESDIPETAPETNIPKMVSTEVLPHTASDTAALPPSSPQPHTDHTQTEPPVESHGPPSPKAAPEEADGTSPPSAKRARIERRGSEGDPREDGATAPSGEKADGDPVMRKEAEPTGKKKTSKTREMGILEKASKEFEESDEEASDMLDASAASPTEPSEAEEDDQEEQDPVTQKNTPRTDSVAQPQHQPTPQPDLQGKCPEPQGPKESCPPEGAGPGPGQREPVPSASAAHMFLFDNESQEVVEASQPIRDEVAFSQLQLEEVKRRIRGLMKRTNQSLESVTKALLKTSGDWSAALRYLVDGEGAGPFWDRHDDGLLLAGHTSELHRKYGEEGVAKRLAFLDAEENMS